MAIDDLQYKVLITSVKGIEKAVNKHLHRWLGWVPPSFMFSGTLKQLQLPLSSVIKEFKVAKCRAVKMYSTGIPWVSSTGVTTRAGRKWTADTSGCPDTERYFQKPMQKVARTRLYPFPPAVEYDRWKAEERHGPGRSLTSRGGGV